MLGPVFTEWFNDQLHFELKAHSKSKNMDLKILLVLDNITGHTPVTETLKHTKVIFLPSNITLILQPTNHGVTATFKDYYL
jgi:hypothetical protein